MTVVQVMSMWPAPDPLFTGRLDNDDTVLAIDISPARDAEVDKYVVAEPFIEGINAQVNATTQDKNYIRAGVSSAKTGAQRTFQVTGDRCVGDAFQDFAVGTIYKTGQDAVVPYVKFDKRSGRGEKGECVIIVNSDGGGNAGETAAIDIELRKTGSMPVEYQYAPAGELTPITLASVIGSASGTTIITAYPGPNAGITALFQTAASVELPAYGEPVEGVWTAFTSGSTYTAASGETFAVAYVDADGNAKAAGKTTVVAAA